MPNLSSNSDSLPLRGWAGGLLVAFRGYTLVIIVSHPLTGLPVSADYGFFFALAMLLPRTWYMSSISQGTLSYPFQISLSQFCLKDISQDQTGLPPKGWNRGTIILSLSRAIPFLQHCASSRYPNLELIYHCWSGIMYVSWSRGMGRQVNWTR